MFLWLTWLNNTWLNIPDSAIQLHGLTCYQVDRDSSLSGKAHRGGLCVYINKEWCINAAVVSKFYQHVNFATRGNNTLDIVCTTEKNAYKAAPCLYLGYSDHISVMLFPAYRPHLKLAEPVQKQSTVWPDDATSALQSCFQDTDWNMFRGAATCNNHTDLQEYTVTSFVHFFM